MAKISIKFPPNALLAQRKRIERQLRRPILLEKISDGIIKDMRKGVNPKTGNPFKRLAPSTIKRRKRLADFNKTDKDFSPGKSNLTFTGAFLNSIKAVFSKTRGGSIILIEPTGIHKGYNQVKGKRGKSVRNQVIAEGQEAMGRTVLTFSKKRIKSITILIKEFLRQKLT